MKLDKSEVQVTLRNNAAEDAVLSGIALTWPMGNGKLKQVKLDGDVVFDTPDIAAPSANITGAQLTSNTTKRTIAAGTSDVFRWCSKRPSTRMRRTTRAR